VGWLLVGVTHIVPIVFLLAYVNHYDPALVHTWTWAMGFCVLHRYVTFPLLRALLAFVVLTVSQVSSVFDPLLLMAPWITAFEVYVPDSMRHLGAHWGRQRALKRWNRLRTLVLYGLFRLAMLQGMHAPKTLKDGHEEHVELDYTMLAVADGAL